MSVINLSISNVLTTTYSVATSLIDTPDGFDDFMTSLTSTATTAGTIYNNDVNITIGQNYIESMSDEQLEELVVKLDDKSMELDLSKQEPTVKIFGKNNPKV